MNDLELTTNRKRKGSDEYLTKEVYFGLILNTDMFNVAANSEHTRMNVFSINTADNPVLKINIAYSKLRYSSPPYTPR